MSPHAQQPYQVDSSKDYPFVPSQEEHRRLDEQSLALNELMFGEISKAPVEAPKKILDIGCGTGIQTRLLADKFPDAIVVGIDPSPVPEADKFPDNVRFILGRFEELVGKHELLQPSSFELIYQRMLVMIVRDWHEHITLAQSLLRPSGWFEAQEMNVFHVFDADGTLVSQDWRWNDVIRRDFAERGMDIAIGPKIPAICRESGLVNAELETFPLAYAPGWTAKPETERIGRYIQWAFPPVWKALLARSARPENGENPDELLRLVQEKVMNGPIGNHGTFDVTVARKAAE